MENTEKVLFEDDTQPHWYVALGERWIGPLSAADIYEKILAGELTWAHYVAKRGQGEWKRICDIPTFQAAVPGKPDKNLQAEVKAAAVPVVRQSSRAKATPPPGPSESKVPQPPVERCWFLYYSDSQFGPFSADEISRFLNIGKIHGRVHAWRDGMSGWERLEKIAEFDQPVANSAKAFRQRQEDKKAAAQSNKGAKAAQSAKESAAEAADDKRGAPPTPLVARIFLASGESVMVAMCRDISVGGMQVLTDKVPGVTGERIKMNVSPAGEGKAGVIRPFVAEGVIVRVLEDGRGFSFRFERLAEDAKKAIQGYIDQAG